MRTGPSRFQNDETFATPPVIPVKGLQFAAALADPLLTLIDEVGSNEVAGDIDHRGPHPEQNVDTGDQGDGPERETGLLQQDSQPDEPGAWDSCGADRDERGCEDDRAEFEHGHVMADDIGSQDHRRPQTDDSAVHIDGRAQWDDEACDLLEDACFPRRLQRQGSSRSCSGS